MAKHLPECRDKGCIGCGPESEMGLLREHVEELETSVAMLSKHIIETETDQYGNEDPDSGREWVAAILEDAKKK